MRTLLNRYLDTNGDGTGTKNANTNAAGTFYIQPSSSQTFIINRLTVVVEDVGALVASGYGALAAMTTGIGLSLVGTGPLGTIDLLDGIKVKRHYDWLNLPHKAPHVDTTILGGVSNNIFIAEIVFPEPLVLNGKYAQSLQASIPNENLTGLVSHYFIARGTVAGET